MLHIRGVAHRSWTLEFRVEGHWGLGFRVEGHWGLGFRVEGLNRGLGLRD